MKKLITICLFMATVAVNAQTKEETIAWIKEKMEKYGKYNYSNLKITPCEITYDFTDNDGTFRWNKPIVQTLTYSLDKDNFLSFNYNENLGRGGKVNGEIWTSNTCLSISNSEKDIAERMLKALKHLSTFCLPKKETF